MSRPEHSGPPEIFYNETEASKYTANSHIIAIQSEMADRALELLALPDDEPALLLDIGCGSGLSGDVLSDAGHHWIGLDVSGAMLKIAQLDREVTEDLILKDMGHGLPFRPGSFDGAIRVYLVLMTGGMRQLPKALTGEDEKSSQISNVERRTFSVNRKGKEKLRKGSRAWIEMKKERAKKKGRIVHETTQYSGRKRKRFF